MAMSSLMLTLSLSTIVGTVLPEVGARVLHPIEVEFAELEPGHSKHLQSIASVKSAMGADGLVSITKIPGFADLRSRVLLQAHACISRSPHAQSHTFPDGTTRRTLAGSSSHLTGLDRVDHGSTTPECEAWDATAAKFRSLVAECADKFGRQLDEALGLHGQDSLLAFGDDGQAFHTVSEMVTRGERLEHFHSYSLEGHQSEDQTIDFHVDQGVFIAFTPALMTGGEESSGVDSGTFDLWTADGVEVQVSFNSDSLVILAGDSLQQVLQSKQRGGTTVHAPMHAFRVPQTSCVGCYRLWYGMMQLPPANAVHEPSGLTFGELRQRIIAETSGEVAEPDASASALGMGCSRKLQARELAATCSSTQIYCWHRCFDHTQALSPEVCEAKGLTYNCTSQWDEIWLPEHGHGDYNPACTNSTTLVTPLPYVPQPEEGACDDAVMPTTKTYANRVALVDAETYLEWNVVGKEVEVRMSHYGRVGWMAVGIENVGGGRNGMYGSRVVMGQHNPESEEPLTVKEYKIHDSLSAYRHWKTPYSPAAVTDTMMSVTDCHSVMTFKTSSIFGKALNVTSGSNMMIWALTHNAYVTDDANGYAAYHAGTVSDFTQRPRFRGHVVLEFTSSETGKSDGDSDDTVGAASAGQHLSAVVLVSIVCMMFVRSY